jgi:hypothetical protein
MKSIKIIFVFISLVLVALWCISWTPIIELMPDAVKQVMFAFGGVLTFIVPFLLVGLVIIWVRGSRQGQNRSA